MIINLMKWCLSSDEVNKIEYEKLGNKPKQVVMQGVNVTEVDTRR